MEATPVEVGAACSAPASDPVQKGDLILLPHNVLDMVAGTDFLTREDWEKQLKDGGMISCVFKPSEDVFSGIEAASVDTAQPWRPKFISGRISWTDLEEYFKKKCP